MNTTERALDYMRAIRTYKEHMWTDHQQWDLPPRCGVTFEGVDGVLDIPILALDRFTELLDYGTIVAGIVKAIHKGSTPMGTDVPVPEEYVPGKGRKVMAVVLFVDGYLTNGGADDDDEAIDDLAADFKTNPDTKVIEALTLFYVEATAADPHAIVINQTYSKADGGGVAWGSPVIRHDSENEIRIENPITGEREAIVQNLLPIFDLEGTTDE